MNVGDGKPSFSVFGSCASRDAFDFDEEGSFELREYIARQSVFSAIRDPVPIVMDEIRLSSAFQRRMVFNDFSKNAFELLKEDRSGYLIVDLIDEQFAVIARGDSAVTLSTELGRSGVLRWGRLRKRWKDVLTGLGINRKRDMGPVAEFCRRLRAIYPPGRIFVHRAHYVAEYVTARGERRRFPWWVRRYGRCFNAMVDAMYDAIVAELPGCVVVDECRGVAASAGHKWGLSPTHYEREYYLRVLDVLRAHTVTR